MKIIHLADEIWDSGLTDYAISIATAQKKAGQKVYFAALKNYYAYQKAQVLGLDVLDIPKGPSRFASLSNAIKSINPNVLNAHTGSTHTLAIIASKISGCEPAVIRTRADARPVTKKLFANILWNNTDGFVAANNRILLQFQKIIGNKIPSTFIPQGLITAAPPQNQQPDYNTIGIISRLDPVKGHKIVIEALPYIKEEFPNILIKAAGKEENTSAEELLNYAKKLNVAEHLRFEGFVEDKYEFMQSCAFGIIPSTASEAVSRAAMEWLSQGKPVIASNVGGLSDIITGETGILIEPENPKKLANAIIELIGDRERLEKMASAARKHFLENFTSEISQRKTDEFYNEVISNKFKR
ncbi:MAG TPA: glycosyltransferase family 4 protein [Elusimicrobiales bacterium]|nr:glycosyltransferase family 4 protein [Elusimicrobiales bacterium]